MTFINKVFWAMLAGIVLLWVGGGSPIEASKPEKVTFCHVAGRADDPANHITLTLPWVAVYGQAGHFNENGTPQAGHEQDYLGECDPPTTTTTVPVTTVPETTIPETTVPVTTTPVTTVPKNTTVETSVETIPETTTTIVNVPNVCMLGSSYEVDILPYGEFELMDSDDQRVVGSHSISGIPCGPLSDISTPPSVTPVSTGTLPETGTSLTTSLILMAILALTVGLIATKFARRP